METRDRNIIITLENGEKVGFRFDNWALRQTQKRTGCKGIVELFTRIGIDDGNIDMDSFIILVMEAANEYYVHQKIDKTIDERTASDYIDEMGGITYALKKISEGLLQFVPKNSQPPQMEGEAKELILQ